MWRFLVGLFAVIGVLVVVVVAIVGGGAWWFLARDAAPQPPDRMVLTVDLRTPLPTGARPGPLRRILDDAPATLHETIAAIDRAAADDRVTALVGLFGGDVFGLATAQELRAAIARFRESGKPALAYADSFGEFGPGNVSYYLATAFDEIWVQPIGAVGLTGIHVAVPFAAEALSEFGIDAEFVRRGPYKSAPESLTERGFTEPHREMVESLTGDLYDQMVTGIAEGREIAVGDVRRLIDGGPYLADAAETAGLIDGTTHREGFEDLVDRRSDGAAERVSPTFYLAATAPVPPDDATEVAVIYANGLIAMGDGDDDPLFGAVVMGSDTISGAIDAALADDAIEAIVLRIDSGGGSAVASEVIGRAVRRAAAGGKPMIVSMGEAAASGGYWIAAYADEIVAEPATLTGSIGVFAGKIVTAELWDDLGVNWQGVGRGEHAGMWSSTLPYSASEAARVEALVDGLYDRFVQRVAEGRNLPRAAVEDIAGGRVWTGAQARELGLVDRLGGLDVALAAVREALGLGPEVPLDLVALPETPTLFEEVLAFVSGGPSAAILPSAQFPHLISALRPFEILFADPATRALRMPAIVVGR